LWGLAHPCPYDDASVRWHDLRLRRGGLSASLLALLVACHAQPAGKASATAIACAPAGAATFTHSCSAERVTTTDGDLVTLRNPDGSGHRLLLTPDGRAVARDGSRPVGIAMADPFSVEVTAGRDRYRLSSNLKSPL
jgi:hypothetical protein